MGCSGSKKSCEEIFLSKLRVVNYGVLGKASTGRWQEITAAPAPDDKTLIVDPCSAKVVSGCPADAGGAAGAIYDFVGIRRDKSFPADVVSAIKKVGDVAYHRYGYPDSTHVIHAVGVDFRKNPADVADATAALVPVYTRILLLAARLGKPRLRIPPISTHIFAGRLASVMPDVTARALTAAVANCARDDNFVSFTHAADSVELCIYERSEVDNYKRALGRVHS